MKRYVRSAMYVHDDYSDLDAFSANRFDRCTVARNTDDLELMEVCWKCSNNVRCQNSGKI